MPDPVSNAPLEVTPPHGVASGARDSGDGALVFVEDSDEFDLYTYRLSRVIYQGRTAYQQVLIGETYNYGLVLMLDGAIQSAEDDQDLYHEMLVQPGMLAHPAPRNVLIIGGGGGATLYQALAHRTVESAVMVDIDREVVELCRRHLGDWHRGAFDDPRTRLVFSDGRRFVEETDDQFDVAIIDVVDLLDNGPAQAIYTRQFYEHLRRRLRPGGIVVVQGLEFSFLDDRPHAALARTLRTVFPEVHSYRVPIPSFLATWGFLLASDEVRLAEWSHAEFDRRIADRLGSERLIHADGQYLKSCFVLCKKTRALLLRPGPILEDGVPFVLPPEED